MRTKTDSSTDILEGRNTVDDIPDLLTRIDSI